MGKFHSMNVMKNGQILIFFLLRYHRAMSREIISLPPYRTACGWTRSNRHSWFSCARYWIWKLHKGKGSCNLLSYRVSLGIHQQSKSGLFLSATDLWSTVSPAESSTWWARLCHLSLVSSVRLVKTRAVVAGEDGAGRVAAAVPALCTNALRRLDQVLPAHELWKGNSARGRGVQRRRNVWIPLVNTKAFTMWIFRFCSCFCALHCVHLIDPLDRGFYGIDDNRPI